MTTLGSREGHPLCAGSLAAAIVVIAALTAAGSALAAGPPAGVSTQEWATIQTQIEAERHKVVESDRPGRLYRADNPTQRFTAHFGAEDVLITPRGRGEPDWQVGLRLTAWGDADDLQPVQPAGAIADGNRVEYRRGPLTEWYVNTTMGLEQGFTIEAPPGDDIGELVLEMAIESALTAELAGNAGAVTFRHGDSTATLTYSGLHAWDAVDTPLDARMELAGGGSRLRLVASVTNAAWPIEVDPIFTQVAKLLPTPNLETSNADFGRCVAVDGDLMAVSIQDDEHGASAGAVYLFQRDLGGADQWGQVARITAADGDEGDFFGGSVSIDGDTVIVGAIGDDDNGPGSGSAYLFQRDYGGSDSWGQVAKISAADGAAGAAFGWSVSITADTAIVGAPFDDEVADGGGSAYVFQRNLGGPDEWGQLAKINAADSAAWDLFGSSVAANGDTVIVGAPGDADSGPETGSGYVFRQDQGGTGAWGQVAKITAADGSEGDSFGSSVALDLDTAVIGAPDDDDNGHDSGSAYIFRRDLGGPDAWGQTTKIISGDGASQDGFGGSVTIYGDTAAVGAERHDLDTGSAYVFRRDQGGPGSWGQVAELTAAAGLNGDYFGSSVSLSDDTAVVGARGYGVSNPSSTFVFQRDHGGPLAWGQVTEIDCPGYLTAEDDSFGTAVAVSSDTAVVGAGGDNHIGSAYMFRRNQSGAGAWGLDFKVVPPDGSDGDRFGYSVSTSGDIAIVGAAGDDDNGQDSGSAYIFQDASGGAGSWELTTKITALDGATGDGFGGSVSVSGDIAVVGAPLDDDNGVDSGSLYVFGRDQGGPDAWGHVAKILPADGEENDTFGVAVSIDDETVVVGAYWDGDNGPFSGSAYVFQRHQGGPDAWGQVAKITAADGAEADFFGKSAAISNDTITVGAVGDDDKGPDSGSAYVFQRDQGGPDAWGQVAKITAADGAEADHFGWSVSISADSAVVCAWGDDDDGVASGSAYLFRRNQGGSEAWGQVGKITAADGSETDNFGLSVSVSSDTIVVGAPNDDAVGNDSGSAYVFTFDFIVFADGFETGDTSVWSVTVP